MLKPKKKISKKDIKQDTLLTSYAKATTFYYENKKYVNYVVTGLIIVIVAIFVYSNNKRANNEKAATELGKVFGIYDAAANDNRQFKVAIEGQPDRGIMGLKAIVDNYGSTASGEVARFYLANAYLNLGQCDEALKQFDNFSGGNSLLKSAALAGMGRCYEIKGDYTKAASNFERAANVHSDASTSPDYINSAARCYGLAGDKEKAISLFKRLKKEYPTSTFAREADRYITQFSA
ncbi:MAG: tetratricopeptide repeat protein [Ignavibacteria bacterium]|nr:tetratricopeptide repeat protein [Ignavibacteria bacterium]MBI3766392.1 tetratricopeptide repeat protein [Ignavibacteriales bacterium]